MLSDLATLVDQRIRECHKERGWFARPSVHLAFFHSSARLTPDPARPTCLSPSDQAEPMQPGHTKVTLKKTRHHLQCNLCFYYGNPGHIVCATPAHSQTHSHTLSIFMVSESDTEFIDAKLTKLVGLSHMAKVFGVVQNLSLFLSSLSLT